MIKTSITLQDLLIALSLQLLAVGSGLSDEIYLLNIGFWTTFTMMIAYNYATSE